MLRIIKNWFWWPGDGAVALYRLSHALNNRFILLHIASRIVYRLNIMLHATDIDPQAIIGERFILNHSVGIVIGRCTIGNDVEIFQNVTLGSRYPRLSNEFPVIGNKVTIYAGAVVIGCCKIGDGAKIGANAVVLQDVPTNAVAIGVPAKIKIK